MVVVVVPWTAWVAADEIPAARSVCAPRDS